MSAAHVRRGGAARPKARKPAKKIAKRLPASQARANKVAALVFGAFVLAIGLVVLVALDIPAKAERIAGAAVGEAGFTVSGYQIVGINHMNRSLVDAVVTDELRRAADEAGSAKAPQALVDVAGIRRRLLGFGWVKDARVSRRLPDALVIDIVERAPAALWQSQGRLALIDSEGAGRQDARPAAVDRPRRQWRGAGAQPPDRRGADPQAPARLGDLGRRASLGPQLPVRRNARASRR
jgi:cell division protein FtsQ